MNKKINILIAPDKMKGTLTAYQICQGFELVAQENDFYNYKGEILKYHITSHPLADGGDGSLDVLWDVLELKKVMVEVHGPLMELIDSYYAVDTHGNAYIEMAAASGLVQVPEHKRNCMHTTSYGFGELIHHAMISGIRKIYLFLGGSATCDAGLGMASALGYQFLDRDGNPIQPFGGKLKEVRHIKDSQHLDQIKNTEFITLYDVNNPILGKEGAAPVFAPQKGANAEEVKILEKGIKNIVALLQAKTELYTTMQPNEDHIDTLGGIIGGGAAGGMGLATYFFLGAMLSPGTEEIMKLTDFNNKIKHQDFIISAEGCIDSSTLSGKVPYGVCMTSKKHQIPCYVLGGAVNLTEQQKKQLGAVDYYSLSDHVGQEQAISEAEAALKHVAKVMLNNIASGQSNTNLTK